MARERAQLILVAGIGIAVTFVALALVLNTVIYTQNLATRSTVNGADPIATENTAITGVGGLVSEANYYDYDSYRSLNRSVNDSVAALSGALTAHAATRGVVFDLSLVNTTRGTHVVQETNRTLTRPDDSSTGSWMMAQGVDVRAFRFALQTDSINDSSPLKIQGGTGPFSSYTTAWSLAVEKPNAKPTLNNTLTGESCVGSGPTVTLDVTGGTFDGEPCPAIPALDGGPYDLRIQNGKSASGRYTFIADQSREAFKRQYQTVFGSNYPYADTPGNTPYAVPSLYAATMNVSYHAANVDYTDTAVVAPESKPGGEPYMVAPQRSILNYVTNSGDTLNAYYANGTHTGYHVPSGVTATVVGPDANLDSDPAMEFPVVYSNKSVAVVDEKTGRSDTLVSGSASANARASGAVLWTGHFRGQADAVWFAGSSKDYIYNVTANGTETQAYDVSSNGIHAVAGAADINGDGARELVYVDGSGQLRYVTANGTTEQKISNGGAGSNFGPGVGRPYDFNGDGTARVPFVDGSNNLKLVDGNGNVATLVSGNVAKAPVGVADVDGDGSMEIVFERNGSLYYVDGVGTSNTVERLTYANGTAVNVTQGPGSA